MAFLFYMKQLKSNIDEIVDKLKDALLSIKQNRDLLVFLLFFVLATGLWFLNALRKEYTTTITYPVDYIKFPKDFIVLGKPQTKVQLKIKSSGYSVLPYHLGKVLNPEELNVSSFRRMDFGQNSGAYVLTDDLKKSFSDKLSNGIELIDIFPDTLFVNFEKKERKKVAVKFNSTLEFQPQYYQSGQVMIKPDSVEVAGPASVIDSIDYIETLFKFEDPLSDSLKRNVSLKSIKDIEINPSRVVINIPVEPFTQKNLSIPIDQLNVPDSLRLRSFPGNVNVSFTVAVSQFNNINAQDFSAIVDYNTYNEGGLPDRLKIKLLDFPNGIKSVNYSPLFVECLFEKVSDK